MQQYMDLILTQNPVLYHAAQALFKVWPTTERRTEEEKEGQYHTPPTGQGRHPPRTTFPFAPVRTIRPENRNEA